MLMRAYNRDNRLGPVENLATNPAFARALAGSTAVRRNLVPNPIASSNNGWAAIGGGTGVNYTGQLISNASDGPTSELRNYYRTTKTVLETSGSSWLRVQYGSTGATYGIPVTPKRTYTFSIYGRAPSGTQATLVIIAVFRTSANQPAAVAEVVGANRVDMGNGWYRYYVTATAPIDAANAYIHFGITAQSKVGDTVDCTGAMVEERPGILPFFYGGTAWDRGISYAYSGTAGASSSIASASVTEVRRNLSFNPEANPNTSLWQSQVPTGYTARVTYEVPTDSTAAMCAVLNVDTVDGATAQFRIRVGGSGVNINSSLNGVASVAVSVSFDFWASSYLAGKVHTLEIPVVGSPSNAITYRNTYSFTPAAGWNRIEIQANLVPMQTLTSIDFIQHPQVVTPYVAVPAGTVLFKATRALIEFSPQKAGPYFSGFTTPDPELTPAWLGAAENSGSTLNAVRIDGMAGNAQAAIAWLWNSNAARIIPIQASNDTAIRFNGEFNGFPQGMLPGRTYTIMARIRVVTPQTGVVNNNARRILVYYWNGFNHLSSASSAAPNVAGVYDLRYVWTVPAIATQSFLRLYNGASVGMDSGVIQWERVQIIEGNYTGPYIDGDSPRCIWRGIPHASISVGYPKFN